jgi:hypothetical protein
MNSIPRITDVKTTGDPIVDITGTRIEKRPSSVK